MEEMNYFPFKELQQRVDDANELVLFTIIVFLVYIWVKLFLYWDK